MRIRTAGIVAAGLVAAAATQAQAQEWTGNATIYGWLPVISGEQENEDGDPRIEIDAKDILEALDFAFMAAGELQRDRFGLMFDGVYADLSEDASRTRATNIVGTIDAESRVDLQLWFASLAGSWRAYEEAGRLVDLYAGARAYGVDTDFTIRVNDRARTLSGDVNWVDPIVGVRASTPISERWSLSGRADVGGFGVGSELTWQAYGGANYDFSERFVGTVVSRALNAT